MCVLFILLAKFSTNIGDINLCIANPLSEQVPEREAGSLNLQREFLPRFNLAADKENQQTYLLMGSFAFLSFGIEGEWMVIRSRGSDIQIEFRFLFLFSTLNNCIPIQRGPLMIQIRLTFPARFHEFARSPPKRLSLLSIRCYTTRWIYGPISIYAKKVLRGRQESIPTGRPFGIEMVSRTVRITLGV